MTLNLFVGLITEFVCRFSCKNPKCPSKSIDFSKKAEKTSPSGLNTNTVIVVRLTWWWWHFVQCCQQTTTTVCEDALPCESPDDCDNPDCDMKDQTSAKMTPKKKRKRKNRGKFVYSMGDNYPGNKVGHKECVTPMFNVPPNMGWLWNIRSPIVRLKVILCILVTAVSLFCHIDVFPTIWGFSA